MSLLLRIGIPTYNREKLVLGQLEYLKSELDQTLINLVEVVVSDNASEDNTQITVQNYAKDNPWLRYQRNYTNLGIVGNINSISLSSSAKFTWLVGDDDVLDFGLLRQVISILQTYEDLSFVFLNHDAFDIKSGDIWMKYAFTRNYGYNVGGRAVATDIFVESGTSLMFITACIYRTDFLKEIIEIKKSVALEMPLLYGFYCASRGPIYLFEDIYIHNSWGGASWLSNYSNIMYYGVIRIINNLYDYNYSREQIYQIGRLVLAKHQWYQIKHLFLDSGFSLKMFRYYNSSLLWSLLNIIIKKIFRIHL